jgi:hypothetical protein
MGVFHTAHGRTSCPWRGRAQGEYDGHRRLNQWCWTLRAGGSDRPMSSNQQGRVQTWRSVDSG